MAAFVSKPLEERIAPALITQDDGSAGERAASRSPAKYRRGAGIDYSIAEDAQESRNNRDLLILLDICSGPSIRPGEARLK
jgi:hypothetical protein